MRSSPYSWSCTHDERPDYAMLLQYLEWMAENYLGGAIRQSPIEMFPQIARAEPGWPCTRRSGEDDHRRQALRVACCMSWCP